MTAERILAKAKEIQVAHSIRLHEALTLMHVQYAMLPIWSRVWLWLKGE